MTIRPIETLYRGYRFRSRLEARWAVFFDALNLKWLYEPEGFETPSGRYLPDFHVDKYGWFEVKPRRLTENEREKAFAVSSHTHEPVYRIGQLPEAYGSYCIWDCDLLQGSGMPAEKLDPITAEILTFTGCKTFADALQADMEYYRNKYGKPHPRHFKNGAMASHPASPFSGDDAAASDIARSARFEFGETP